MNSALSNHELQILRDLIPYVSHEEGMIPVICDEHGYRMLYEASEARYSRMKALVRASVEKQAQMAIQLEQARAGILLRELDIQISEPQAAALWETANELRRIKEENLRLKEMNQSLRSGLVIKVSPEIAHAAVQSRKLEAELLAAKQQISAMDLELLRMSDQRFEDDERLREYEDVLRQFSGVEADASEEHHPRFHPITTCKDLACRAYARRLRNGLRQAVAEVL